MGNSGFGSTNERKSKRTNKFDVRHSAGTAPSFPKTSFSFNRKDQYANANERKLEKPTLLKSNSLFFKEEAPDTELHLEGESDDNPPLQPCPGRPSNTDVGSGSFFQEFPALRFAKTISHQDELSLLDEVHLSCRDIINEAMSEFDTKCSRGQDAEDQGDSDILSLSELRNTVPFGFSGSISSANSSQLIKCHNRSRISI